jgi:putative ABC transport system ATP-binding protein
VDLLVPSGQRLAIVGPSGSGKSTLLGLIAGLDAPSSGSVLIDGTDVTRLTEDQLARLRGAKIGFVFQSFHLIPSLTALENILVPMEIAGRRDAAARARPAGRSRSRKAGTFRPSSPAGSSSASPSHGLS